MRGLLFILAYALCSTAGAQESLHRTSPLEVQQSKALPSDPMLKWKVGMEVGIHASLLACNQQFPESRLTNEAAYKASVFSHPKGDEFYVSGIRDFEADLRIIEAMEK